MVVPKNRPDTTTVYQDKIQWYNLQIATWKQVLANNEMAKVTAIENHDKWFDKNYSIDSGTAFESSVTNDTTTSHTNSTEWNTVISAAYGNETKISGVGVTFTDNVEVNTGGHWSDDTGTTHTTTTSYSIVETGDDDSHTIRRIQGSRRFRRHLCDTRWPHKLPLRGSGSDQVLQAGYGNQCRDLRR
jgi:hypothetical protein